MFSDSNHDVHGHWPDEWHELHVHGYGDERQWGVRSVVGVSSRCAFHCSGCSDRREGNVEFERHLDDFLDGPGFEWWRHNHRVLGDCDTGRRYVRHQWRVDLRRFRSDKWNQLHVHGHGNKRCWYVGSISSVDRCCAFDGPECTDGRFSDIECERSVGCVLDSSEHRWCGNFRLFGDLLARGTDLCGNDCDDMFGHWSDEWHLLHVHSDCDERQWYLGGIGGFGCGGSVDCSGCADRGELDSEPKHHINDLLDGTNFERRSDGHGVHGDLDAGFQNLYDD